MQGMGQSNIERHQIRCLGIRVIPGQAKQSKMWTLQKPGSDEEHTRFVAWVYLLAIRVRTSGHKLYDEECSPLIFRGF